MEMMQLIPLGIGLIFLGAFLVFIGALGQPQRENVKAGFGGFIGPFPFGFATSREMLYIILGLTIAIFLLSFFMHWWR